jgi:hypothetical protein
MRYQYILLDWDGNIAQTLDLWLDILRLVLHEEGYKLSDEEIASSFGSPDHLRRLGQSLLLYYLCDVGDGEISLDGLEEDEREYGLTPEWVAIEKMDTLAIGSTVDWRSIVESALHLK